ncbi:ADP-ribose pyrophosphatase [Photobacterium jeanii]|uniref:GDP-mannose pyrophosphatase n=1 Tax=Photobacterium jeanii TaxID=858640 RepID=A0A178K4A1_9GAMM|nr:NUDIX hydrolase [Photobacterium jeanii]OAN11513.1 ADP-ribose pyrophosphatase [Photobacterium jeanii]PST91032.1 NUDIX hydrolase [Photobacterium jeanii]
MTTQYQWKCFSVEEENQQLPDGRNISFTWLKHPGAVIIIPITAEGKLVLVNQYRPAIKQWILEFPAGTLEDSEQVELCAQRELAEEVQLAATTWHNLGQLLPVPGFCDEVQHLFVAKELSPCDGELDDDEIIEVKEFTVSEFEKLVASNQLQDGKTIAAYMKAKLAGLIPPA